MPIVDGFDDTYIDATILATPVADTGLVQVSQAGAIGIGGKQRAGRIEAVPDLEQAM